MVHESEARATQRYSQPPAPAGDLSTKTLIDPAAGSRRLLQRVVRIRGHVEFPALAHSEEVLYVVEGSAWLSAREEEGGNPLWPGTAVLIPPGRGYALAGTGPEAVTLVSVVAPPPDSAAGQTDGMTRGLGMAHEDQAKAEPAGHDRSFKVLIDTKHGARHVTQFVGFIERGRAPFHTHTYEEAIYVLEGEGTVHVEDRSDPLRPGSSVFLPPGAPHCLESLGLGPLKVLGVFSPPGSPAQRSSSA